MQVIPTSNFERNLDSIATFLAEREEPEWFDKLLDRLFGEVIPNLESFPDMGVDFMVKVPASVEGMYLFTRLAADLGDMTLREYLFDHYLLLYARTGSVIYLLSIKHHAQLSFDLNSHWL